MVAVAGPGSAPKGGNVDERPPTAFQLLRRLHQLVERRGVTRDSAQRVAAALVAERGLRDLPALVDVADEVRLLGAGIGHEDFGEERAAGDLLERAHLDAGLAHV